MQKKACWFLRYLEEVRYVPSQANGICAGVSEGDHFVESLHNQVQSFIPRKFLFRTFFFIGLVKLPHSKE